MLHVLRPAMRLEERQYLPGQGLGCFPDLWRVNMSHLAECHSHCFWEIRPTIKTTFKLCLLDSFQEDPRRPNEPFFIEMNDLNPSTNQEPRLHERVSIFQNRSDNSLAEGTLLFCLNRKVDHSISEVLPLKSNDVKLPWVFHPLG